MNNQKEPEGRCQFVIFPKSEAGLERCLKTEVDLNFVGVKKENIVDLGNSEVEFFRREKWKKSITEVCGYLDKMGLVREEDYFPHPDNVLAYLTPEQKKELEEGNYVAIPFRDFAKKRSSVL